MDRLGQPVLLRLACWLVASNSRPSGGQTMRKLCVCVPCHAFQTKILACRVRVSKFNQTATHQWKDVQAFGLDAAANSNIVACSITLKWKVQWIEVSNPNSTTLKIWGASVFSQMFVLLYTLCSTHPGLMPRTHRTALNLGLNHSPYALWPYGDNTTMHRFTIVHDSTFVSLVLRCR